MAIEDIKLLEHWTGFVEDIPENDRETFIGRMLVADSDEGDWAATHIEFRISELRQEYRGLIEPGTFFDWYLYHLTHTDGSEEEHSEFSFPPTTSTETEIVDAKEAEDFAKRVRAAFK